MTEETERIYIIPLRKKDFPASKAAPTAIKRVKNYINRHMKVDEDNIWIDESLNNAIWSKGKYKMPGKIRVKAVKFDDGVVEVYLPELEFEKSRRELLQEERAKKAPILHKEEAEVEEEVDEAGTDDYEVVPTADGDVKLKKKKHHNEGEEEESEAEGSEEEEEVEEPVSEEEPETKKESSEPKKPADEPEEAKEATTDADEESDKKEQS
jgi:large subunit ribosomal protein L31e